MIKFNVAPVIDRGVEYMASAIKEAKTCGDGPYTKKCHAWIEEKTGTTQALLTTSGTQALELAAILSEVKEGDDQILTHRFVPCRRVADGELGVYDTVARQFLYDTGREARGADVFLAGPVVGDGWRPGMVIRLY